MGDNTAFHALSTADLVDILVSDAFSRDEKSIAADIVKERFYSLHTQYANLSRRIK
jgi:hypothetical protein